MTVSVINGEVEDRLSVLDRGLQYGDGVFETMAILDGHPQHWDRHLQRLRIGCERLGIEPPTAARIFDDLLRLPLTAARHVLKIIITRGPGGRGYRAPSAATPTRILSLWPWPDYPARYCEQGVTVQLCDTPLGCNPRLAGIKHLNRLEQVMARSEWSSDEVMEGLMLDTRGDIIAGTMSNVFFVLEGMLHTPSVAETGIAGIMRQILIDHCDTIGAPVVERRIGLSELGQVEEIFLTNSLIGLWPVAEIRMMSSSRKMSPPQVAPLLRSQLHAALPPHAA